MGIAELCRNNLDTAARLGHNNRGELKNEKNSCD